MKRLLPLRTYSSPSRRAVVSIAAESEPEPASVSAYAAQPLPGRELRQVALLLLLRPRQLEPERAELLHGEQQAARRADLRDLLDRDEREQRAGAGAAPLLVVEQAEQLVLAEELDDVPRELVRLVDLGRARRHALARERAHELADLPLLVGQDVPGHRPGSLVAGRQRDYASEIPHQSDDAKARPANAASGTLSLRRKVPQMTAAELKRKLRNSPFAPMSSRIQYGNA